MRRLVALAAVLGALLAVRPAQATTVVPVAADHLIDQAVVIVTGEVRRIESQWDARARQVFTFITLDVHESLKGGLPAGPVTIKQAGGRVGGLMHWVHGSPEFTVGERVLVFLTEARDRTLRVAHLYQGKFSIRVNGATGEATAVRDPGRGVRVLPGAGRPPADRKRLDDLRHEITVRVTARPHRAFRGARTPPAAVAGQVTATHSEFTFLGAPARWFEPDNGFPISMLMDSDGEPAAPGQGFTAIRDAYAAWNAVSGSSFRFVDGGFTTAGGFAHDGVNAISFRDPLGQIDPPADCGGTLAIGGYFYDDMQTRVVNGQTFYRIVEGDVVFADGWQGCNFYESHLNFAEVARTSWAMSWDSVTPRTRPRPWRVSPISTAGASRCTTTTGPASASCTRRLA